MTNKKILDEIDSVLAEYEDADQKFRAGGLADADTARTKLLALLQAAIHRLSPPGASYTRLADKVIIKTGPTPLQHLNGILQALRADYAADRIKTFQELVHSDLFADMLEAADYLLGETYKDPAAVMAGGVLEQHLRELCRKHGVDPEMPNGKPKMLDGMNTDLAKASVYGKIEQKDVTAWAGIRNAAAHGQYGDYDANQVGQMITGIRGFIIRHPA